MRVFLIFSLLISVLSWKSYGQEESALSKLGLNKVKPEAFYEFNSSISYQISSNKSGDLSFKYYFGEKDDFIGVKFLNSGESKIEKNIDFIVVDVNQARIFNFMNNDGKKIYMGVGLKPDKFQEYIEKPNSTIEVSKSSETKNIMGVFCEGYLVKDSKEKTDFMMWVSKEKNKEIALITEKLAKSVYDNSKKSGTNVYKYSLHPEFIKMTQDGRAIMGYSLKGSKGEVTEMEIIGFKTSDFFNFKSSEYKSIF